MSTPTAQTFEEWWIEQGQERWASGLSYGEIAQAAWNAAAQQARAEGYAQAKEDAAELALEKIAFHIEGEEIAAAIRALKPKTDA